MKKIYLILSAIALLACNSSTPKGTIPIEWTDHLASDFSFSERWNYGGAIFRNQYGHFRYAGMYEDVETGLCYNRHRYYDPDSGNYLSQDPIGLAGGNPTLYGYVHDPNSWLDPFGLDLHHATPIFMGGAKKQDLVYLNNADHVQLHRDMNAFLETKTKVVGGETVSMRPKRGSRSVTIQ